MPSESKQKIYIVLVIIFFGGVLEILPEQVTTIVPAIFFIWETFELFFNKNALAGYKLWLKKKLQKISQLNFSTYNTPTIKSKQSLPHKVFEKKVRFLFL